MWVVHTSYNVTSYNISIIDQMGNVLHSGPWIQELPNSFCIQPTSEDSWNYGIEPNASYTLVLEVGNECGDLDQFAFEFDTPGDCDELEEPCYNLPAMIINKTPIYLGGETQLEICWRDLDAEFYEIFYQLPGMEMVSEIVSGTCFTITGIANPSDIPKLEIIDIVAICDCSDDPPIFELDVVGNPCNSSTQLCLNFTDYLSSEFYEIEWFGPDGLISFSQNGPTCLELSPDMSDGEYYAIITFYWGESYGREKCNTMSTSFQKNCNCPEELFLNYDAIEKGSVCRGAVICVSDNYGYIGSDKYYTISWYNNGFTRGVLYNEGECRTFPAGTTNISVVVTYYSDSDYEQVYCSLTASVSFNCDCPEGIEIEESETDCGAYCIDIIPEDYLLIPGYYSITLSRIGVDDVVTTNLCNTFSQDGFYTVRLDIYSETDNEYIICSFSDNIIVDCGEFGENPPLQRSHDQSNKELLAYPNPFHDKFYIESREEVNGTLLIYNVLGKVIFLKNLDMEAQESLEISTESFGVGVYIVKIYNEIGIQYETKMIKID